MGEHRGGSRGELRHGALVAATVLFVLALVAAWSVLIPGFMDWDDIVAAVIGSLRLTGPLGAAFAAWVAFRRRRAEKGRVLTPWRAARAPLSIIAVVTGSFGATVLLLGLRAALTGQGGPLLPGGLAMSVAGLGLYVVIGWILGWLVPVVVVPLIAGAGTFGLFTWLATGPNWADRLAPATGEPYDLLSGVSESAYADQTLWLLGLSTALLLGWVALVTRRTLALAAAVIAVLAAGTGAARLVTVPRTMQVSERLVCQEWPISVCVHPALRGGLAELATVFTKLAMKLDGTPAAFKRVEQRAYGEEGSAGPGVVVVHIDDLGSGYAQRAATEFLDRLARPCPGTVAAGYRAIVVAWLRNVSLPGGPLREHREASVWFSELSDAQRHDWLRMFYSDFVSCGLQAKHFGGGTRLADPVASGYPVNPTPAYAPEYPVEPTPAGTAVATGLPAGPDPGWERGTDPSGGETGPGWTGPSPSAPVWPSPAASPADQDPAGQGPMGRGPMGQGPAGQGPMGRGPMGRGPAGQGPMGRAGYPGPWDTPNGEGARRGGPWAPGPGRSPHPWRPGRTGRPGDTASPDRPGAPGGQARPGESPSPVQERPGRPQARPGGGPGASPSPVQEHRPGRPQSGGPVPGSDGHDRRPGRTARVGGRGDDHDGGRDSGRDGGRTDGGRPATGDTDSPQDDPGVAGVPGTLLAPAA
ncbi:hypothetical protein IL992_30040 [Microbispora sp. NEAU-D428]|uniref:hypothetical protein n=1 Tax=Microbispora sitophila TaxID=2771537 RepID=UPI001868F6A5|nr:hypothetical protein [Microbispora sitophila]MBE3013390.1 hypothetical protein [Microbispora sitophila]